MIVSSIIINFIPTIKVVRNHLFHIIIPYFFLLLFIIYWISLHSRVLFFMFLPLLGMSSVQFMYTCNVHEATKVGTYVSKIYNNNSCDNHWVMWKKWQARNRNIILRKIVFHARKLVEEKCKAFSHIHSPVWSILLLLLFVGQRIMAYLCIDEYRGRRCTRFAYVRKNSTCPRWTQCSMEWIIIFYSLEFILV